MDLLITKSIAARHNQSISTEWSIWVAMPKTCRLLSFYRMRAVEARGKK